MKPNFFILAMALFLAAIILISGCNSPNPGQNTDNQNNVQIPEPCQNLTGEQKEDCVFYFAKNTQNETLCPATGNISSACYKVLALLKKDASLCEKTNSELKGNCYFDIAVAIPDEKLCEKSEGRKDYCYSRISLDLGSPLYCDRAGAEKEACYYGIAYSTKNASLCEKTGLLKDACYANTLGNITQR